MPRVTAKALIDISKTEGSAQPRTEDGWYWYVDEDEGGAIPFNINVLYRGQNGRFLPMRPSIARGLRSDTGKVCDMPTDDQALVVLRIAQSWWFARELDSHPIALHAKQQNVKLDRIALAQHYGVPTGYLDLTDGFDVAAFFATCHYRQAGWCPMDSGTGIVYMLALKDVKSPFEWLLPLGPQPLPRPSEQRAWVAELPLHHSFDGWPVVYAIEFEHDRTVGEYFLNIFDGGHALFPPDPLAKVAAEICGCNQIPYELVEKVLEQFSKQDEFGPRPEQFAAIRSRISAAFELTNYRTLLTSEGLQPFLDDFEWRQRRLADIKANSRPIALRILPPESNA